MNFLDHTLAWVNGEIFEAKLIVAFSMSLFLCAILFRTFSQAPNARAMFYPLLVVGLLFMVIGGGMLVNNTKRISDYSKAYQQDAQAFVQSEKIRVEAFQAWYPKTRYISGAIGILGIILFLFWHSALSRAIGISLLIAMIGVFVIDHFSEERAGEYYSHIVPE